MVSKNKSPEWERERAREREKNAVKSSDRLRSVHRQGSYLSAGCIQEGNSLDSFLPPGLLSDYILAPSGHSGKKRVGPFKS